MQLNKEDDKLLMTYATAALQGWFARFAPEDSLARVNYEVVATGCFRMALTMLKKHKQIVKSGSAPDDRED